MNDGLICISVCPTDAQELERQIASGEAYADAFEVRFDCLEPAWRTRVADIITNMTSKPVLATLRTEAQGSRNAITRDELAKFISIDGGKFWAVDVEDLDVPVETAVAVSSFHDFEGVPAELRDIVDRLSLGNSSIIKMAAGTRDAVDAIPLWQLLSDPKLASKRLILAPMGDAGKWVRILALSHGAFLTFAALDDTAATAPGQVTAKDMTEVFRARELSQDTRVFGVLGDPISQSLSPYMHNPAFAASGEDAVFISFLVKDIEAFLRRMVRKETREVNLKFGGFSVTMPHKRSIMRHLDEIDDVATAIGAVNTVEIADGRLIGRNTDAHGFISPLKARLGHLKDKRVAVCGGGGAARACVFALLRERANVEMFVRNVERDRELADTFGVAIASLDDLRSELSSSSDAVFDVLVDTTPLGMSGPDENLSLFTAEELKGVRFVYDLVTKSDDTPIIREAKAAGIPAIGGIEMLLAQGARQFAIWTGKEPPLDLMRRALLSKIESRTS